MKINKYLFCFVILYLFSFFFRDYRAILYSFSFISATYIIFGSIRYDKIQLNNNISYYEITFYALLPLLIFFLSSYLPFPWDKHFILFYQNKEIQIFPSLWFILLYLIPFIFFFRNKLIQLNKQLWTFNLRIILLIVLFSLPVLLPKFIFYNRYTLHFKDKTTFECFLLGFKAFYFAALWEEVYYRGFILTLLLRRMKPNHAIIINALIFSLSHVNLIILFYNTGSINILTNIFGVFILGLSTAFCFVYTKSIIPCIIFHFLVCGSPYLAAAVGKLLI